MANLFSSAAQLARQIWDRGPGPRARMRDARLMAYTGLGGSSFTSRLLSDMPGIYTDANGLARTGLAEIRAKAREQALWNPYGRQATRSLQTNIIGARGVQMRGQIPLNGRSNVNSDSAKASALRDVMVLLKNQACAEDINSAVNRVVLAQATLERDETLNTIVETKWRQFCRAKSFDLSGKLTFNQYELMIIGAMPSHGGALVRIIRSAAPEMKKGSAQICFQLLSTSHLDETYAGASDRPGHYWRLGIETNDQTGRVTRYAILTRHPNSSDYGSRNRDEPRHIFVDAKDMIHVFFPEEIGQLREIPWLACVLPTLHNINQYEQSHWTRKRVVNNTLGFIEKSEEGIGTAVTDDEDPDTGELISRSAPGQWITLLPGERPIPPAFGPDDQMFDVVLKTMLRRFSSGIGLSYSTSTRDYSDANYSSLRECKSEDKDFFRVIQSLLIQQFHQRVYEEWFQAAMLSGELPSDMFANYWVEPDIFLAPRWQARTWGWVDPEKEMKAYKEATQLGLQSTADQMAELYGTDLEQTWAQMAYETMLRARLGLPQVTDGTYQTVVTDGRKSAS